MEIAFATSPITISMPTGSSALPLVELDKSQVSDKGKQVRLRRDSERRKAADCSFGNFTDRLDFKAIEFFHAAKKTELTTSFSREQLHRKATDFADEYNEAFIWNTSNFRKTNRNIFSIADFDSHRLAGRVGEAIAYLTMVKWNYVYWDRCTTIWQRAAEEAKIDHSEQVKVAEYLKSKIPGKPDSEPDFVFEKSTGEVALMEAKGGFVHPSHDNPPTKGDLDQAITQLAAWSEVISPAPSKSYGIGTYLREEGDSSDDPSLVAFVDPEGEENPTIRRVRLPPDIIRRFTYGAWLAGMGLVSSGIALRNQRRKTLQEVSLPVVRVMNRDFAITVLGWKASLDYWLDSYLFGERLSFPDRAAGVLVIGLDVNTLRFVERAIHNPKEPVLLGLDNQDIGAARAEIDNINWSIMPDGSCLFLLDRDFLFKALQKYQIFKL